MPLSASTRPPYSVALRGFSDFECEALASVFRLAAQRTPAYARAATPEDADFLIADADHAGTLDVVKASGRVADTVFVGASAPAGAMAWLPRPIDPMHILRELDFMVHSRASGEGWERLAGDPLSAPMALSAFALLADEPARRGGAGREVLVVEDSPIARKFLQRRLERLGYRVQLATTAEEALALHAAQPFAVIFLDIGLGDEHQLDGLQACQRIRQHPAGANAPPVVLMTGSSSATDRVRGSLAGCSAYLTKPLGEAEFFAALREVDPAFEPADSGFNH